MPNLTQILLFIPIMLITLTVHEYMHGRVAYALGDPTARSLGRLTLNPIKHIDPIGALCMIFLGFGWAKPVPVNSRYFKRPQRDMALVAIAGPISNLVLALLGCLLFFTTVEVANALLTFGYFGFDGGIIYYSPNPFMTGTGLIAPDSIAFEAVKNLILFFYYFHFANITLAVFNLIPIPPLDGSRVLTQFLPPRLYWQLMQYEQYFGIALMILVLLGSFTGVLSAVSGFISDGMVGLIRLIPIFS